MNMIYTNNDYCIRRFSGTSRRKLFWNKAADVLLCAASAMGIITALCPHIGYQQAASIAKTALRTGESVRSLILKENLLDKDTLDEILNPISMTEPGISAKHLLQNK